MLVVLTNHRARFLWNQEGWKAEGQSQLQVPHLKSRKPTGYLSALLTGRYLTKETEIINNKEDQTLPIYLYFPF